MYRLDELTQAIIYCSLPEKYTTQKISKKRKNLLNKFGPNELIEQSIPYRLHFSLMKNFQSSSHKKYLQTWYSIVKKYDQVSLEYLPKFNLDYSLLKFFNFKNLISSEYSNTRYFNDLDILCKKNDSLILRNHLLNDGFCVGQVNYKTRVFSKVQIDYKAEIEHYELSELTKIFNLKNLDIDLNENEIYKAIEYKVPICFWNSSPSFDLVIDLHHNISNDLPSEFVIENYFSGVQIKKNVFMFSVEDFIWYNTLKS